MGVVSVFKRSTIDTIAAELSSLGKTHASLADKRDGLIAELEAAKLVRRDHLIADTSGPPLAKAEARCSDLESRLSGVADALAEIERRQSDARGRLETAERAARRMAYADDLTRSAAAIEKAAGSYAAAAATLVTAQADLAASVSPNATAMFHIEPGTSPERVAHVLAGHILSAALPAPLAACETLGGAVAFEAIGHEEVVKGFLTDAMRLQAERVRAGEAVVITAKVDRSEVEIFVEKPLRYRNGRESLAHAQGVHAVPSPVAAIAIERGLALDLRSDDGQARLAKHRQDNQPNAWNVTPLNQAPVPLSSYADLDFDVAAWREAQQQLAAA